MSDADQEFIPVARIADIPPGERLVVELGRKWVVIFNVDGAFYAVEDECTHEEVPLSEGALDGCEIECHKHGARFDLRTGAVTAPPAVVPVRTFRTKVEGDQLFIARK
ncbi:MAG: non-heme iron oxygenase ferredoxin subunit [Anaerolineae bacterium]|nr:non-heme iron oxygenase ferredoxin subunit [Anaerolineae bacterium]